MVIWALCAITAGLLVSRGCKNVSWPWLSPLRGWGSLTMAFTGKFVYITHHFILLWLNPFDLSADSEGWWFEHSVSYLRVCFYNSIALTSMVIGRDGSLNTLCQSCGFACQQRVLKTFPGLGYLRSEDGVVWQWHLLVNLYIYFTISFCYDSISLTLVLIGRDDGLSTLCQSYRFASQQRVLKMFPGPSYLCLEDGVVWQWHLLVNLYI